MATEIPLILFLALCVAEVIRNRWRISALPVLDHHDRPAPERPELPITIWQTSGTPLSLATRKAVGQRMEREGWDAVDLIPASIQTEEALELLPVFTPESAHETVSRGVSAGRAVAVRSSIAGAAKPHDAVDMMVRFSELVRHAEHRTQSLIVPQLDAIDERAGQRREILRQRMGIVTTAHIIIQAVLILWMISLLFTSSYGWLGILGFHLQPMLIFGGTALRPRDRNAQLLLRLPRYIQRWWHSVRHGDARRSQIDELRQNYETLAEGQDGFFLPSASSCPICAEENLAPHVSMSDMIMFKPGRFNLDRCEGCGHVFQNPQLSPAGLSYYYRDCYDGIGESDIEQVFAAADDLYEARAAMVQGHLEPKHWLDVGTGHGHFCQSARKVWPHTRFEGLDMGSGIERGKARGWLDATHNGMLHEHAEALADRFDVVSMFHYLEHTPNPQEQINLAAGLLRPGGMLMIEVPNPDSVWGKLLGRFWLPWFQPQHLHFLSVDALGRTLERAGMRISRVDYLTAAGDMFCTAFMLIRYLAPGKDLPWRDGRPGSLRRILSALVWVVGSPLLLTAAGVDALVAQTKPARHHSNAYRVLAQRT
ncbi:MAG: class I SAM-dependent methyltransferase [Polyangiaceae bacterium]